MTDLLQIETWFKQNGIPKEPFRLDQGTIINDPVKFVENHIATLKRYSGVERFSPYYNRLLKFYIHCYEQNTKKRAIQPK